MKQIDNKKPGVNDDNDDKKGDGKYLITITKILEGELLKLINIYDRRIRK